MNPVRKALTDALAGDATLTGLLGDGAGGIHHRVAKPKAATPYVIVNQQAGTPEYTMKSTPVFERDVWLVKAVDHDHSASVAEQIAARIDTILNGATLTLTAGTMLDLRRTGTVDYGETDQGGIYQHRGGLYRLTHAA